MSDNLMRVQPIRNGTVIDHIKAGRGRKILDALELSDKGTTITLLMHVPSEKNSSKDVIKIEDRELSEAESQKLALLSPGSHVNIIRNFVVAEKNVAELPNSISDMAFCSNVNCISNNERGAKTNFTIANAESLNIQCVYCGRKIAEENIEFI
ncbi:MAG: aspartate carbamoyltransferase regulatory subunit [Marine Group III euryarchaeote CG-Epi3]|jgi:aspartate carbamoyltransferase regulatory subunit|uniref:Aspartate carbamoyltransferase regulatory chain n=1 Tax=Marine Group III euryarchaeote CG-Epi3 TaxID=1888997 RepID=A0A1J5U2B4_9ARCH|nr:MAG: aspartate carbamoyltransferase regulatory subunit [Marine Group III euryarchaeote CG-Epi3]|tara:strand:- start:5028 stop:5486 length:459 start_codon:yes stop_codon:yes gene_type:complete